MAMAQRRTLIQTANDIQALAIAQCHAQVSPAVMRLMTATLVMGELREMADRVEESIRDNGEVTERCYRYLRENVRDLAVNVLGRTDVPTNEAATSLAAD
jgi:lipase chaperone LimK